MPNNSLTFGVDLLPNSTTKEYSLGSLDKKWNIFGDLTGNITGNAATVNNLTVQTAVPANAVFTDKFVNVTATSATISHNYLLMTSTAPTSTATLHTALASTSMWINSADKGKFELVLGNATSTGSTGGLFGLLALFSASTTGTYLKAADSTSWKTATLPAITGTLAILNGGTAKGSNTKPVKVAATGEIQECSDYAGGTKITLNGTDKGATTATIYAATSLGTEGLVLKVYDSLPTWRPEYSIEIIDLATS